MDCRHRQNHGDMAATLFSKVLQTELVCKNQKNEENEIKVICCNDKTIKREREVKKTLLLNGPTPAYLIHLFSCLKSNNPILQQINMKNVHPVSDAGFRTHIL